MATYSKFIKRLSTSLLPLYPTEEAKNIAVRLLNRICSLEPYKYLVEPEKEIDSIQLSLLNDLSEQLINGRPLQYVLGFQDFYCREFMVREGVLIPRVETEELVSWVKEVVAPETGLTFLDIGSGSGCIGTTIACELPGSTVYMCDFSDTAILLSSENSLKICGEMQKSNSNIIMPTLFKADILLGPHSQSNVATNTVDFIISNPPYVLESEKELMNRNVLDYEPHEALFVPDNNPLIYYRYIADWAIALLKDGGGLFLEINEAKGDECAQLFMERGFSDIEIKRDIFGKERMVHCRYKEII